MPAMDLFAVVVLVLGTLVVFLGPEDPAWNSAEARSPAVTSSYSPCGLTAPNPMLPWLRAVGGSAPNAAESPPLGV